MSASFGLPKFLWLKDIAWTGSNNYSPFRLAIALLHNYMIFLIIISMLGHMSLAISKISGEKKIICRFPPSPMLSI